MVKKLLFLPILILFFFLAPTGAVAQECTATAPTVTITNNTGSPTLCKDGTETGTEVSFTSNDLSTVAQSYQWEVKLGNGNWTPISGATNSSLSYSNAAIGSNRFRLVVTYCNNSNGNEVETTATSTQSGIITVYEKKKAEIAIQASNNTFCPEETVAFSIISGSTRNLGGEPSYAWRRIRNGTTTVVSSTNTYSDDDFEAGDKIQLYVKSSVPCVDPVESNIITLSEKPGKPAIPGTIAGEENVCPGVSETYSITDVTNASEYIWTLPTGWLGSSTTNSITVTTGTSGSGNITVKAANDCGISEARTIAVSVKAGTPATPGTITGTAQVCPGISQTYTISEVTGASSYEWALPTGWTGTSTTNSITLTPTPGSAVNGNLAVKAVNDCGTSPARTLAISVKPGTPDVPSSISGAPEVCPGTPETYSITGVDDATEYIWTLPDGWSGSSNSTSINVTTGQSGSGQITVKAKNDCGTSTEQTLNVSVKPGTPVNPGGINGSTALCPGDTATYSVGDVTGATSYNWTVPSGWSISQDNGNEITVTAGSFGNNGAIRVTAENDCGTGTESTIAVSITPPAPGVPGTITGPEAVCSTETGLTYSISPVTNATTYNWDFPSGWTITNGEGTNSVTVNASSTGGGISVTAENSCGVSTEKTMDVEVTTGKPTMPGVITSSDYAICPPATGITLSVEQSSDAESYEWFLPNGWVITNGEGTNTITVKVNSSERYNSPEIVGVEAVNNCGNSERRTTSPDSSSDNAIAVSDYVYVNLGEDQTVCKIAGQTLQINGEFDFGNGKLNTEIYSDGTGTFSSLPSGNFREFSVNYKPTAADYDAGQVTITFETEKPTGACERGKDEMTIYFRNDPTVNIAVSGAETICYGSSSEITFTGGANNSLKNAIVTYNDGGSGDKTIALDDTGVAILSTGNLTEDAEYSLVSIAYPDSPECSAPATGTATISVTPDAIASFSYQGAFCSSQEGSFAPVFGTESSGAYSGGTYEVAPSTGLEIDDEGNISPSASDPGTYVITYIIPDELNCGYNNDAVTTEVTIYEEVAIYNQPSNVRVCEGDEVELDVAATGEGLTYQWYKDGTSINGATTANYTINTSGLSDEGSYHVVVSGTGPCANVTSDAVSVVIDKEITITSPPVSTEVCENGSVEFSVGTGADEEPLIYQWQKNGANLSDGTNVSGSTTSTLELSNLQMEDAGDYAVVVSGSEGYTCGSATSEVATLGVRGTPIVEISGDAEICDGGSANLSFTGTANTIVTFHTPGGTDSIQLNSEGIASYDTGSLEASSGEATEYGYSLVSVAYEGENDCTADASGTATVIVNPIPNATVSFENDQVTFCNSANQSSFTPNLTDGSGAFEGGTFSATGLTVDPENGSFSPSGVAAGDYTLSYTIEGSGGCEEQLATLDITIYSNVEITSQPFNVAVCTANSTQLEVAASGDDLSYQWYKVGEGTDTEVGVDSPIFELKNVTASNAGEYYVIVSGDNACAPAQSETVVVTVDENIIVEDQPDDRDLCVGDNFELQVSATASGSNENIQYRWMYRPEGSTNENDWTYISGDKFSGEETSILSITEATTNEAGQYRAEINGPDGFSCDLGYSEIAQVKVYDEPTADAGAEFIEVCSTATPIGLGTGATATNHTSIEWTTTNGQGEIVDRTNLTGATYVPVEADFGEVISFILTATLEVDGVTLCAESEASDNKQIKIIPVPEITGFTYTAVISDTGTEFCETDNTAKTPSFSGNYLDTGARSFSVEPEGLDVHPETGVFTPNGTEPGDYVVTYTHTASSETADCVVATQTFTVTIGEKPVADFSYGDAPFCNDAQNPSPQFLNEGIPGKFTSTEGLVFVDDTTGEVNLLESTPGTYKVTNTVDFEGDGCQPVVFDEATITINAKPAAPEVSNMAYCLYEENVPELTATAIDGAVLNWYDSIDGTTVLENAPVPDTGTIGTTSYWVSQTTEAGCESERAQIDIEIYGLPTVSIITEEGASVTEENTVVICEGSNIKLIANGASTYTWKSGDLESANIGEEGSIFVDPTITTTYYVIGTNENGCEAIAEITVEVDETSLGGTLTEGTNVCYGNNSGTLNLTDERGEIIRWESSIDDWATINTIESTEPFLNYNNLTETTRYRAVVQNGVCEPVYSEEATIIVDPVSKGGIVNIEGTTDKTILVCHQADESSVTPLVLTGSTGDIIRWEYSTNSGSAWIPIDNTSSTQGYEGITETRIYRAIVKSGNCSEVPSAVAIVSVIPNVKPSPVSASPEVVCLGEDVELFSESSFATGRNIADGGTFNSANPDGWLTDGCGNCLNAGGSNTKETGFRLSATNGGTYSGVNYQSDNKFAITNGNYNSVMETPVFNLLGITTATLDFNHAYRLLEGASARIEISLDGGNSYSTVLEEFIGEDELEPYATSFPEREIDLTDYLGQTNLRIRFVYKGTPGSSWAIDNVAIPDEPVDERMEWVDDQTGEVISTTETATVTPTKPGINTYRVTSYINGCRSFGEEGTVVVEVYAYDNYTAEASIVEGQNLVCGYNSVQVLGKIFSAYQESLAEDGNTGEIAEIPEDDNSTARWSVKGMSQSESDAYFDNPSSPLATFTAEEAGTYTLLWTITPGSVPDKPNPCGPSVAEIEVTISNCTNLIFDGEDDIVDLGDTYTGKYSFEAWIKPDALNGTILSGPGFELSLVEGKPTFNSVTAGYGITTARWYHIAVSTNGNLYIDGIKVGSGTISSGGTGKTIIGARWNEGAPDNYFKGWIEEVRIWDAALTEDQIRFMMNQRLQDNTNIGVEIPMPLDGRSFGNLAGYYQLIVENININAGTTPNSANPSNPGRLINMTTNQENTAPLPYTTSADGKWTDDNATWTHHGVWDIPNANGVDGSPITWNIARTSNNVTSDEKDITVLGLIVESNELEIADPTNRTPHWENTGQMLQVTHYLKLDGAIDLVGESQLLQDPGSIVDPTSSGFLERDQQGTASSYNYNYWSSPVNSGTGNALYTIAGVMKDGSQTEPLGLSFGDPYAYADGEYTNPRRISNYWLHKFHGTANSYGEWLHIGSTGTLKVGEGYSMKGTSGSAKISDPQNYTFKGIPNNGTIELPGVSAEGKGQNYLVGNPYPSAIDANEFIRDNMRNVPNGQNDKNIFNGTLYFWSHFAGATHYLEEYIGGYATYNLSGGVIAYANDERIDNSNPDRSGGKEPKLFIPVGQAFFVNTADDSDLYAPGTIAGGPIQFKNSQRVYHREIDGESVFHKPEDNQKGKKPATEERSKIWIKFHSPAGYHRQLLVTADQNASNNFDLGYDAPLIEDHAEDMYWFFNNYEFVIQGVNHFNEEQELPLGIKIKEEGSFTIKIDQLKNIPDEMNIYLRDSVNGTYHDLREEAFQSTSGEGIANNRFTIVFKKPEIIVEKPGEEIVSGGFDIFYVNGSREILVRNPQLIDMSRIYLNNMLGQQVMVYYDIPEQEELRLPVHRFSAGVYIIKAHTEEGIKTKKIIIE